MSKELKNSVKMEDGAWAHFWLGGYKGGRKGKLYLEVELGGNLSNYGWSKKVYTRKQAEQLEIHIADSMQEVKGIIIMIFYTLPEQAKQKFELAEKTFHA